MHAVWPTSAFARHYSRNHGCFLLLRVLRCFTSPRSLSNPIHSGTSNTTSLVLGFPIRTSSDHSSVDSSPRLIAASHVLHRLLVPRHPPYAHKHLTKHTQNKDARVHCAILKQHTPTPTHKASAHSGQKQHTLPQTPNSVSTNPIQASTPQQDELVARTTDVSVPPKEASSRSHTYGDSTRRTTSINECSLERR